MNNLKYSIIYAVLCSEISEQLSVGLIIVDGEKVEVRYSQDKLDALRGLFSDKKYRFLCRVIKSLSKEGSLTTIKTISYLTHYSNNLITISPLQSIDISASEPNKEWLLKNYVYDRSKITA